MSEHWSQRREGGNRLAVKIFIAVGRHLGRGWARALLYPSSLYFFLRRGGERRASRDFLHRAFGRRASTLAVLRHMHWYGATILDRMFLLSGALNRFDVRVHGLDQLEAQIARGRGVLLLGAHIGSFEVLRSLAVERPGLSVRVVMDRQQTSRMTELLHALNPAVAEGVIDAGQDGASIALAIHDAARQGALIGMLADRARPLEATRTADFFGSPAAFPVAPYLIASMLELPTVLCFGLYRGGNRYELYFETFAESIKIARHERETLLAEWTQHYAARLEHYTRLDPYNWFNFYDFCINMLAVVLLLSQSQTSVPPAAVPSPDAAAAQTAAPDAAALIARLGRPAPSGTGYVEVRFVHMLRQPIVLRGELEYGGAGKLGKRVEQPYREMTTIAGDNVDVQREGRAPRHFSLDRAPELQALLAGFSALLGGDAATLEKFFKTGLVTGTANWTLTLTPRDAALARHLREIVVDGSGTEPGCFSLHETDGDASIMLLGALAASALDEVPTRPALDGICHRAGP